MKSLIKAILRKLGLLQPIRRLVFRKKNVAYVKKYKGRHHFPVSYAGLSARFSLDDAYSANFFGVYCEDGKVYEPALTDLMLKNLGQDSIFVDVGANIGYFSCLIAKAIPQSRVYAFEMGHENFDILRKNIALNGITNVTPELAAVSDSEGVVECIDAPVGSATLSIVGKNQMKYDPSDLTEIRSISLDNYFGDREPHPFVVKIDVEGAEAKVLKGMERLLARDRMTLLIEIHKKELKAFGSSEAEVRQMLAHSGFQITDIDNGERKNIVLFCHK